MKPAGVGPSTTCWLRQSCTRIQTSAQGMEILPSPVHPQEGCSSQHRGHIEAARRASCASMTDSMALIRIDEPESSSKQFCIMSNEQNFLELEIIICTAASKLPAYLLMGCIASKHALNAGLLHLSLLVGHRGHDMDVCSALGEPACCRLNRLCPVLVTGQS